MSNGGVTLKVRSDCNGANPDPRVGDQIGLSGLIGTGWFVLTPAPPGGAEPPNEGGIRYTRV